MYRIYAMNGKNERKWFTGYLPEMTYELKRAGWIILKQKKVTNLGNI